MGAARGLRRAATPLIALTWVAVGAGLPPGAAANDAVEVVKSGLAGGARPCAALRELPATYGGDFIDRSAPLAAGGCAQQVRAVADMSVMTAVGEIGFGRCRLDFTMRVDGVGKVSIGYFKPSGPFPCNDVVSCYDTDDGRVEPLTGQFAASDDGEIELRTDMCLDTCMGRFAGPLELSLERARDRSWRLTTRNSTVGLSGWRMANGAWSVKGSRAIDVQPATQPGASESSGPSAWTWTLAARGWGRP